MELIKFFASDLVSLLFPKEAKDTSGISEILPESIEEAWRIDMQNLAGDAKKVVEQVVNEYQA